MLTSHSEVSSSNASMQSGDCVGRYCYVAPGTFLMGSPENELGRKQDEAQQAVEFTYGLYVAKHEVTQRDWFGLRKDVKTGIATPAHFMSAAWIVLLRVSIGGRRSLP